MRSIEELQKIAAEIFALMDREGLTLAEGFVLSKTISSVILEILENGYSEEESPVGMFDPKGLFG
jgi:hypothetical protein